MPTVKYKPTTPARRNMSVPSFEEITKFSPEKSLIVTKKKHAGRNSYGRITVRHRGGGNKVKYRIIDFKRLNANANTVVGIEYDPNRTAYIALLQDTEGNKSYIIAPQGLTAGDVVYSSPEADIKPGNTLPIANIPVGTVINNIEIYPGKGAQLVRSAGAMAQLVSKEPNGMAQVRLPSGEVRWIRVDCKATIGQVGNVRHAADSPRASDGLLTGGGRAGIRLMPTFCDIPRWAVARRRTCHGRETDTPRAYHRRFPYGRATGGTRACLRASDGRATGGLRSDLDKPRRAKMGGGRLRGTRTGNGLAAR